ncbi:MAG: glucose/galactose MFS transporter, partial [Bacteroidota bacterium]
IAELDELAKRVINPYITIAIILVGFSILLAFLNLPEIKQPEEADNTHSSHKTSILQFPFLVLGAVAIFFYVGVEVISYDTFAGFGESLGFSLEKASGFAKFTGYGLLAGYVLGILLIPKVISQRAALIFSVLLSMALVVISIFLKGWTAVYCFAGLGFSNAIMWPAIWPLAINGLGRFTRKGAALLIMGIAGGAILPPLYGKLADVMESKQMAYWIMIPCYIYILYFATVGYKAGKK